jgi:shikimate kinase
VESKLVLVGFMGVGKSTVGPLVARALSVPFVDLDLAIEAETGRAIPEIFRTEGESGFREIEARTLEVVMSGPARVLACGGGAPCQEGAMVRLKAWGLVAYLHASLAVIKARVDGAGRPLWGDVESLFETRVPLYRQSDIVIDAERAPERVAEALLQALEQGRG